MKFIAFSSLAFVLLTQVSARPADGCLQTFTISSPDENCYSLAMKFNITEDALYSMNPGLHHSPTHNCDNLDNGKPYCVCMTHPCFTPHSEPTFRNEANSNIQPIYNVQPNRNIQPNHNIQPNSNAQPFNNIPPINTIDSRIRNATANHYPGSIYRSYQIQSHVMTATASSRSILATGASYAVSPAASLVSTRLNATSSFSRSSTSPTTSSFNSSSQNSQTSTSFGSKLTYGKAITGAVIAFSIVLV